MKSEEKKFFHL